MAEQQNEAEEEDWEGHASLKLAKYWHLVTTNVDHKFKHGFREYLGGLRNQLGWTELTLYLVRHQNLSPLFLIFELFCLACPKTYIALMRHAGVLRCFNSQYFSCTALYLTSSPYVLWAKPNYNLISKMCFAVLLPFPPEEQIRSNHSSRGM